MKPPTRNDGLPDLPGLTTLATKYHERSTIFYHPTARSKAMGFADFGRAAAVASAEEFIHLQHCFLAGWWFQTFFICLDKRRRE